MVQAEKLTEAAAQKAVVQRKLDLARETTKTTADGERKLGEAQSEVTHLHTKSLRARENLDQKIKTLHEAHEAFDATALTHTKITNDFLKLEDERQRARSKLDQEESTLTDLTDDATQAFAVAQRNLGLIFDLPLLLVTHLLFIIVCLRF